MRICIFTSGLKGLKNFYDAQTNDGGWLGGVTFPLGGWRGTPSLVIPPPKKLILKGQF